MINRTQIIELLVFISLIVSGCGVYLEYPQGDYNEHKRIISYNDSARFCVNNKSYHIDSVIDISTDKVYYPKQQSAFCLPATNLKPGNNNVRLNFHLSNGKKRNINEQLFMISDIKPEQYIIDNFNIIPHDTAAFIQGLIFWNNYLYESTGLKGESSLRIIDPATGDIVNKIDLDKDIFAEGIALCNNELYMLTWKDGLVFRFNKDLEQIATIKYHKEGWGLADFQKGLIASDGSDKIYHLNTTDLSVDSVINVFDHRGQVQYINELETINGKIWANVLGEDVIIVIDPYTGRVINGLDISGCIDRKKYPNAGVLNGIAYDKKSETIYLTGKNWPYIVVINNTQGYD